MKGIAAGMQNTVSGCCREGVRRVQTGARVHGRVLLWSLPVPTRLLTALPTCLPTRLLPRCRAKRDAHRAIIHRTP